MDAIIVAHKKDIETLDLCIDGIRDNIANVDAIIVISEEKLINSTTWFDERHFPFQKQDVADVVGEERAGWYFQQLLKLYSILIVPNVSKRIVIVDADTVFLNMIVLDGFGIANKMHLPYFEHMQRLLPGLVRQADYSGTVHYMIYDYQIIQDLMGEVEAIHRKPFWKAFLDCIDPEDHNQAGASEQEIYFSFTLRSRLYEQKIQKLKCITLSSLDDLTKSKDKGYVYASCHNYLRAAK